MAAVGIFTFAWDGCDRAHEVCAGAKSGADVAATIQVSLSTNSSEIDVVVHCDASAERTLGPSRLGGTTSNDPAPKSYPPGSPEVMSFLVDLAGAEPLSAIPTMQCLKSTSTGTTLTITAGSDSSADLECIADTAPLVAIMLASAASSLAHDP